MTHKLILMSGPCGCGKTTLSRLLAENPAAERTVHMHTDDFYHYIKKGYIPPWETASKDQNEAVIRAASACAGQYALGGYEVYVDGVVGPWFLGSWRELARQGVDLRYIILRPSQETAVKRALEREQNQEFSLTEETVRAMWRDFAALGPYEAHAVNTEGQSPAESARALRSRLDQGGFRLEGTS